MKNNKSKGRKKFLFSGVFNRHSDVNIRNILASTLYKCHEHE